MKRKGKRKGSREKNKPKHFQGIRVRFKDLIMQRAAHGCSETADLCERAGLFGLIAWLYEAALGILKGLWLAAAEKYGFAFQVHWKHPGPVSNHSWCGNTVSCAVILYLGYLNHVRTNPSTWHKCNRRNKEGKNSVLSPGRRLQLRGDVWARGSPVLFVIESWWAHYEKILFLCVCFTYTCP